MVGSGLQGSGGTSNQLPPPCLLPCPFHEEHCGVHFCTSLQGFFAFACFGINGCKSLRCLPSHGLGGLSQGPYHPGPSPCPPLPHSAGAPAGPTTTRRKTAASPLGRRLSAPSANPAVRLIPFAFVRYTLLPSVLDMSFVLGTPVSTAFY